MLILLAFLTLVFSIITILGSVIIIEEINDKLRNTTFEMFSSVIMVGILIGSPLFYANVLNYLFNNLF